MERCVNEIRAWMLCDKLKINGGKTEFVVIGTRQQLSKVHVDSLAVGDAQVSPVQSVKNLGTYIDSNMSRQVNINNTCKAAYYYITNVRGIRNYLSNQATQTLVPALIIGRIDYCNSILYGLPPVKGDGRCPITHTLELKQLFEFCCGMHRSWQRP